jgi:hypothetical protein
MNRLDSASTEAHERTFPPFVAAKMLNTPNEEMHMPPPTYSPEFFGDHPSDSCAGDFADLVVVMKCHWIC